MDSLVSLFFVHNVLAAALLGYLFNKKGGELFKAFGVALFLNATAFAVWSLAVVTRPVNLMAYVTTGVVLLMLALFFMLKTASHKLPASLKMPVMVLGTALVAVLFYLRTYVFPSAPSFSGEGLLFFNLHPVVQMVYILTLMLIVLPAVDAVAGGFKEKYAALIRYGFIAQLAGSIVLVTSINLTALTLAGWIIGIAYIVLWGTLLIRKEAWS